MTRSAEKESTRQELNLSFFHEIASTARRLTCRLYISQLQLEKHWEL